MSRFCRLELPLQTYGPIKTHCKFFYKIRLFYNALLYCAITLGFHKLGHNYE